MNIELEENERIDDLEYNGLKIIQNKNGFCFGIDSVLLTDFSKEIKPDSKIMDLGSGTGIIPILLSAKTKNTNFIGVEIQEEVAQMANKSVKLNNLENSITIENENILNLKDKYRRGSFDAITTNPPYKKIDTGIVNENNKKLISRHEITASLEDFIEISSFLLSKFNIEPKKIKFVYPNKNKKSNIILIKGVKCGKPFLKFEDNLYVYDEKGNYTEEILKIYNKTEEQC